MRRSFLSELGLEKDVIDKIMGENGRDIEHAKRGKETIEAKVESLEQQIIERDSQLEELTQKADANDELKAAIESLKEQNTTQKEEYETKIATKEREFAIGEALKDAKPKNMNAVKALLDMDKIVVKDGSVSGLEEQLIELKKTDEYLFETKKVETGPTGNPSDGDVAGGDKFYTKEQVEKMTQQEVNANLEAILESQAKW